MKHRSAPGPWLTIEGVQARLQQAVRDNQKEWATRHGVSAAYVNDVLRGRRLPGEKITRALGLEKALLWRTPAKSNVVTLPVVRVERY